MTDTSLLSGSPRSNARSHSSTHTLLSPTLPPSHYPRKVLVTGASGFVGGHVARELIRRGHTVVCLVRTGGKGAERLWELGAKIVEGDVTTSEGLERVPQVEAVVHLVGIIRERRKNTFENVHCAGTANLLDVAARADARKFVHMSALGTGPDAASEYHRTKWEAEQCVRTFGHKMPWTIFRPSLIYGRDIAGRPGAFVRQMLGLHGKILGIWTPVAGSGRAKMQPIWVGDVARFFADAVETPDLDGRVVDLGGPKPYSFLELQDILSRGRYGKVKRHIRFPMWYMKLLALAAETVLPAPPITRDQLKMLAKDNTCAVPPGELMDFERWVEENLRK
ncbi:MAG: complex I NDUFA9 subunit family protein [Planctomycetota bacterium]